MFQISDKHEYDTEYTVFKTCNAKQDKFHDDPFCIVDKDLFFSILPNPKGEKQKAKNGKTNFDVNQGKLIEVASKLF